MNICKQLKYYRNQAAISQEELAEKIFVSRQTISNWETEKSYPDLRSLLLLSELYQISLDELVKGDVEIMKTELREKKVHKMNRDSFAMVVFLGLTAGSVWLVKQFGFIGFVPMAISFVISLYFAWKLEKFKWEENLKTYADIVAYTEGKKIPERKAKSTKRFILEKLFFLIISGVIGFFLAYFILSLF